MVDGKVQRKTQPQIHSPRRHSCKEERAARLDVVETWLAQRLSRSEIVTECRKRWRVSPRQSDRYMHAAAERLRERAEPEREENRRRNVATVDYAIREACRLGKLRDLAALVKLRARLDGSMEPAPPVPEAAPADELGTEQLIQVLGDQLVALVALAELTPELRHRIADTVNTLGRCAETSNPS